MKYSREIERARERTSRLYMKFISIARLCRLSKHTNTQTERHVGLLSAFAVPIDQPFISRAHW